MINEYDLCSFNKKVGGMHLSIAFHVEDLLITSHSQEAIDGLITELEARFAGVSATRSDQLSYLGMMFTLGEKY